MTSQNIENMTKKLMRCNNAPLRDLLVVRVSVELSKLQPVAALEQRTSPGPGELKQVGGEK